MSNWAHGEIRHMKAESVEGILRQTDPIQELEKKVCEMYEEFIPIYKIIEVCSISQDMIYAILHKNNIKLHGNLKINEKEEKEILKKYGKPIRRKYTDEELEPYSKSKKPLDKEKIIKKWGNKKCKV